MKIRKSTNASATRSRAHRYCLSFFLIGLSCSAPAAMADLVWSEPVNIGAPVNTQHAEFYPRFSDDLLTMLYTSNRPDGFGLNDIWISTRASLDDPWGEPANLGPTINTENHEMFPFLSRDGLTLHFTSIRPGGFGEEDLYVSTRASKNDPWDKPINLGPTFNTSAVECQVFQTDSLTRYFHSDRNGGFGGGDVWLSTRQSPNDPWEEPENVGAPLNSEYGEWNLSISSNALSLFFDSEDRPGGLGQSDFWMSMRASVNDPWGEPANVGSPINTEFGEFTPMIIGDGSLGSILYWASDRPGGVGGDDIWMSTLIPAPSTIGILALCGLLAKRRRRE